MWACSLPWSTRSNCQLDQSNFPLNVQCEVKISEAYSKRLPVTTAVKWIKYIGKGYRDNNLNLHRLYRQYIFNLCLQRRMLEQIFNNHKILDPKPCEYRSHWSNRVYYGYLEILFSIFKELAFPFWIDSHSNSHYAIISSVFTVLCSCTALLFVDNFKDFKEVFSNLHLNFIAETVRIH